MIILYLVVVIKFGDVVVLLLVDAALIVFFATVIVYVVAENTVVFVVLSIALFVRGTIDDLDVVVLAVSVIPLVPKIIQAIKIFN